MEVVSERPFTLDLTRQRPVYRLPSGLEVQLDIRHLEAWHKRLQLPMRCTSVTIITGGGTAVYMGDAWCQRSHFSRQRGRKLSVERAMRNHMTVLGDVSYIFSKEDRRALFMLICPEFPQSAGSAAAVRLPKK